MVEEVLSMRPQDERLEGAQLVGRKRMSPCPLPLSVSKSVESWDGYQRQLRKC